MSVGALAGERYISLTTYKRDGTPRATPVWVVSDDRRRLLVWTGADTWKAKRLRRDQRVLVAACDARGRTKSYGWQKRALDRFNGLMRRLSRKPRAQPAYIEITDA